MIKPDAVADGNAWRIMNIIEGAGFKIRKLKLTSLSKEAAEEFYAAHKRQPFFSGLVDFMTEGNIVVAVLEKENAVADFQKLIGATNPANAESGTIRKLFAENINRNAIHGSDSDEAAEMEINFHFGEVAISR